MTGTKEESENRECTLNGTTEIRATKNSEDEYVKLMQTIFDQNLFPNDFDKWTVGEKYNWINENLSKFYPNVPESLLQFIPAFFCDEDGCHSPVEKPEWLDMDKYRRGQKFVQDYFMSITMTIILSLLPAYTFDDGLTPIILGGRAHTPFLALKRYTSTMYRMMSWFKGDPWVKGTPAFKDMQVVRKLHSLMRSKLDSSDHHEIDKASKFANPWCPDRQLLLKDFADACPFELFGQRPYKSFIDLPIKQKNISNGDLAMVQCCFISFIVLYPQDMGVHDATDEDLEAFCHIWRCYGYYLGIDDKYNFCRGSLEEIKQRLRDFFEYWIIPNFKEISPEWEHMTRCVIEPFNNFPYMSLSYKTAILIITDLLGMNMPRLYASLTYSEWFAYKLWKFVMRYAMMLRRVRSFFNTILTKGQEQMTNLDPKIEAEFHMRSQKLIPDFSVTF